MVALRPHQPFSQPLRMVCFSTPHTQAPSRHSVRTLSALPVKLFIEWSRWVLPTAVTFLRFALLLLHSREHWPLNHVAGPTPHSGFAPPRTRPPRSCKCAAEAAAYGTLGESPWLRASQRNRLHRPRSSEGRRRTFDLDPIHCPPAARTTHLDCAGSARTRCSVGPRAFHGA
ncbi:uncharacterized protein PHACADRAFT_174797 [Phanerochaete carnosa HHB-10118-sp]|uniref:Uncharacterized protein n=1 Tax=Phanerochaete carnosa (strain HHB-10118-sp) TaxID=650164 RepID=K5WV58_PHACS|nr:uncharacterized protein PHACADRAFT_174797 [Phanerochaete carnosa HHB-10118-sp]EKM54292.1 hypothetical protein PHACADRAFT_174797 [Phanerochaete carnosa HHB-10118-sp]